jgi:hypothetical protein
VSLGQEQEAHLPTLLDLAHGVFERAPGRGAAGAVAVEAEDDLAHQPENALQVIWRGGRAERRHGVRDPGLVQADDVHVALDDQQPLQAARRLARLEQAVQLAALVEQFGLRRVEVLGLALVEHATAEADGAAARVADWKHDPVAETVVETGAQGRDAASGLPFDDQPRP